MAQTPEGATKLAAKRRGISVEEYLSHKNNGERWCSRCLQWKEGLEFPKNAGPKNANSCTCLACRRVKIQKSRKGQESAFNGKTHTDEAKQRMAEAHSGERNHKWKGGVSYRKTPRDPAHTKAKRIVNHAIKAGRLARASTLPCFDCSKAAKEYHHHYGYDPEHWLDVIALCRKCHLKRHSG